jgi:hypothetical protein
MTGPAASASERATENLARLRLTNGPLVGPVLRRVVSMMLARADWPVDRLDEAMLVCDALQAHAPAYASDGRLSFSMRTNAQEAELRVLELSEAGALGLMRDAMLPVVGNVIERVAERVSIAPDEQGAGSELVIVLSAS